jgi:hypothetical protein
MMVICAEAVAPGFVALVTDTETGFGEGIAPGATKSICVEVPAFTGWHGLDPVTQIIPREELPPGMPFTFQLSMAAELPPPPAVNVTRRFAATVVAEGERLIPPVPFVWIVMRAWTSW